jgi:hypothetical protein
MMHQIMPSAIFIAILFFAGCAHEQRDSLHESGHFVPDHWPSSLDDAATKIADRLTVLSESEDKEAYGELSDIVGWVPEIAADSDLSEADWIPINEASRKISNRLRGKAASLDNEWLTEIQRFHELIMTSVDTLEKIESSKSGYESKEKRTP